jgi:hypothetical protein
LLFFLKPYYAALANSSRSFCMNGVIIFNMCLKLISATYMTFVPGLFYSNLIDSLGNKVFTFYLNFFMFLITSHFVFKWLLFTFPLCFYIIYSTNYIRRLFLYWDWFGIGIPFWDILKFREEFPNLIYRCWHKGSKAKFWHLFVNLLLLFINNQKNFFL